MNCVCPCHADKSHDEKPCKCCRGNVYTCETLLLKEERDEARRLLETATAEIVSLKDGYTTCEQCDGGTQKVQFCKWCWNKMAEQLVSFKSIQVQDAVRVENLVEDRRVIMLQVGELRKLLENVNTVWGESWDCSAHPGHQRMHYVMGEIHDFLGKDGCQHDRYEGFTGKVPICLKCNQLLPVTENRVDVPECGNCGGDLVRKTEPTWICPKCEL